MMAARPTFLRTRVARRVFGLFVLCAVLPIGALAVISYRQVAIQLREQSRARVQQASKVAGMAMLERLQLLEAELIVAVASAKDQSRPATFTLSAGSRAALRGQLAGLGVELSGGRMVPLLGRNPERPSVSAAAGQHLRSGRSLLATVAAPSGPTVLLGRALDPRDLARGIVWAAIDPGYLWGVDADDVGSPLPTETCVFDQARQPLHCSRPIPGADLADWQRMVAAGRAGEFEWQGDRGDAFAGYWSVFLKASYFAPSWVVVVSESKASLLAQAANFERTFALALLLALLVVLLLSNIQIRKSMEPLVQLQQGTQRLAERDFTNPVKIASGDEFEDLATSFNTMADGLHRQLNEGERLNTALREASESLRDNETRLRTMLESAVDAIVTIDEHGILESFNRTAECGFGYGRAEVIGHPAAILLAEPPPTAGSDGTLFGPGSESGDARGSWEGRGRRKDGSTFPLEVAVSEARLGERVIRTAFLRDISSRKQAEAEQARLEAQLRHSQKLQTVGTLAGGIAHDFNNILTPILSYTDLALADAPDEGELRADLEQVRVAALRAKDLVRQILVFSRRGEEARKPVPLQPIVKEALDLLRASLPTTIEIGSVVEPGCAAVLGDPTQIHQVVMNLCTNSSHAMRDHGGVLEVRLEMVALGRPTGAPNLPPGRYVRVTVRDTGHGMDQATLERVFEPFFTTKLVGEGTGLGLSVVHGIVTSHGGAITVESEPGSGTVFRIFLPAVERAIEGSTGMQALMDLKGHERVLVVDDEPAIAQVVKRLLDRLGYQVTARTTSREALDTLRSNPDEFDLVITDQTMPGMTGLQLAAELRRIRPTIPLILVTGLAEAVAPDQRRALGFHECLMKPLSVSELAEAVRRVLDQGASAQAA